jgi:hypothetical protein
VQSPPRAFWKAHQEEFPALASVARDVLSIPATGAGVERLFNCARDVCHYRRGSLKPKTIQDLMMFMYTSKFEMQESQRTLLKEYLSNEEIEASSEEKASTQVDLDPISDNEEENIAQSTPDRLSERSLGKRRRRTTSEPDEEPAEQLEGHENGDTDDDAYPLPETQLRISGRARKKPRLPEGFEVGDV